MVKITFLPDNFTTELHRGVSVLECAYDNDIDIPSLCQMGTCTTCMIYVEKGRELLKEGYQEEFLTNPENKRMLSCIAELKDDISEGEIIIDLTK